MNLLIELPPRDEKEASGRMIRAFERLMVFASAAKDVILIAPERMCTGHNGRPGSGSMTFAAPSTAGVVLAYATSTLENR